MQGYADPRFILGGPPLSSAHPENDQRSSGESEEEHVDRFYIVQDLIVLAGQRDDRGPYALEHDGDNRNARLGLSVPTALKNTPSRAIA